MRFVGMVKFHFLAHFLVGHLALPVVSSLIFLLCKFATFAYYVIDCFVFVTTFAILLRLIYSRFDMIGSYGVFFFVLFCLFFVGFFFAAIWRDSVSHLKFPFLSHVQVLSCEILFISRLNRP